MGLDLSHGDFRMAYSAFNRLRCEIAQALNWSYPPHQQEDLGFDKWYYSTEESYKDHPGLVAFFNHSDCDGDISPDVCKQLADELEALLPDMTERLGGGHIEKYGGYRGAVKAFIEACREAHAANENLEFL